MTDSRRAATRDVVLICVTIALLVAALLYFWFSGGGERLPASGSGVAFRCTKCAAVFELSPEEASRRLAEALPSPRQHAEGGAPAGIPCAKCGQPAAVRHLGG